MTASGLSTSFVFQLTFSSSWVTRARTSGVTGSPPRHSGASPRSARHSGWTQNPRVVPRLVRLHPCARVRQQCRQSALRGARSRRPSSDWLRHRPCSSSFSRSRKSPNAPFLTFFCHAGPRRFAFRHGPAAGFSFAASDLCLKRPSRRRGKKFLLSYRRSRKSEHYGMTPENRGRGANENQDQDFTSST